MKLHLGCGDVIIPGFENSDILDGVDARHLPYGDNTAELIYASHLLEHFYPDEARRVLEEWRRVLMDGGVLRISVPDFPSLIHIYMEAGDISKILGPLYGNSSMPHYTVYDYFSLNELLRRCGYRNVGRYNWRSTEHAGIDDYSQAYYPHMNKTTGIMVSLNVECMK